MSPKKNAQVGLAFVSMVFHVLWFFLSQQLSAYTPEAQEVQVQSGQPHACLVGWALLMSQGLSQNVYI